MQHYYGDIHGYFSYPSFYKDMNEKFQNGVFVEVGSWLGRSAAYMGVEMINSSNNNHLICVDTFEGSPEHQDLDVVIQKTLFDEFKKNIQNVKNKVTYIQGKSTDISSYFDDNSLDLVFIDAEHSYESVKNDVESWLPKVKKGGILSGHDYQPDWVDIWKYINNTFGNRIIKKYIYEAVWSIEI